ncbi:MAG: methyltransferase domain-containing protein [Elusimicrobia bacterium]|nr:methyltransferase domain-containing protein [Elusimicrobiota bacterium]
MTKLTNDEFRKRFDGIASVYSEILNPYMIYRRSSELLLSAKGKILEVGAGTGNITSFLKDFSNVTLSDISEKMCETARKKHNCSVVCCDAEKLKFPDDTFDTVIASEVIYYLDHPDLFIKEALRVLKKGGMLLISSANDDMRIYDIIRNMVRALGIKRMYFDDGNRRFIKLENILKLLAENGFTVKKAKKIVPIPSKLFHKVNLVLEDTFLNYFGTFIIVIAEKI